MPSRTRTARLSSAYSHAAGDPGEVAAAIVRRAKETKTTYHK